MNEGAGAETRTVGRGQKMWQQHANTTKAIKIKIAINRIVPGPPFLQMK
jgi:hypothetical protein